MKSIVFMVIHYCWSLNLLCRRQLSCSTLNNRWQLQENYIIFNVLWTISLQALLFFWIWWKRIKSLSIIGRILWAGKQQYQNIVAKYAWRLPVPRHWKLASYQRRFYSMEDQERVVNGLQGVLRGECYFTQKLASYLITHSGNYRYNSTESALLTHREKRSWISCVSARLITRSLVRCSSAKIRLKRIFIIFSRR